MQTFPAGEACSPVITTQPLAALTEAQYGRIFTVHTEYMRGT